MRQTLIKLLIIIIVGGSSCELFGQDDETKNNWFAIHPIDFAIGNFSVGVPFSKLFINKFYPLATLGTEFYYLNREKSKILQTAKLGGYYTKYSTSAIFLNTEIGYRYTFDFGLFSDVNFGVGYSHLFRPNALYKLNSSEEYQQVRDWGKPSILANYSISIGYDFSRQFNTSLIVFLRYSNYMQLFYVMPDIPALPQNSFQVGTRFLIKHK